MDHRINDEIRAKEVVLVMDGATQVISLSDALAKADEANIDLVEVGMKGDTPVCKFMDYSKFLYELKKKEKAHKCASLAVKELRLGYNIAARDLGIKVEQAKKWLQSGDRVIVSIKHKSRETQMMNKSEATLKEVRDTLLCVGTVFQDVRIEGRNITLIMESRNKKKGK